MSVKEKELQMKEDELETKSGHHTPEGLFTQPTKDIIDGLLKDANGDEELALKRINFYINRAGDGLSNKTAVHAAKRELEKKVEAKMEANKSNLHDMLSEYFSEAYSTMFEDDKPQKPKKMRYWDAIDFLVDNGINPYWLITKPRQALYFEPYDKIMAMYKVNPDNTIDMLTYENGRVAGRNNEEGKFIPDITTIKPEEFKTALEDDKNSKVVNNFDKHYYDLDTIVDIIANGDELYNAWIERFYNEHKDELDLKKAHSWKTHKAFKQFWNELSNYEKSTYANPMGVSDKYGLATKDPRRGMPVGKIRFKKSPQHLNGKTTSVIGDVEPGQYEPRDLTSDEKRAKLSDRDLVAHWLHKFDIDTKYADQPVKDQSGVEWKIAKALETHNDISPVRFQLVFPSNPDFKIIKKPAEIADMIIQYTEKEESIEEAFGRFGSKMAQPTITDYNALYSYLEQNGIDPKFCRGAILYGDLGQEWRITGYNLSDPENPLIALQSFSQPDETINGTTKVSSNKVPLSVVQKWCQKPKNQQSQIDWENIMLDPFQRQKAKANIPDPERKPMKIKNFDTLAARAKHGVM